MDTTTLVNTHKIRSSVRRLFTGKIPEILGELLQNSQRAGATQVDIATCSHETETGFSYEDNGSGLQEGTEGFYNILSLGDSGFSESVIENQEPMGLGFGSLLACEGISKVTIASSGLSLEIDTKRWWDDRCYYSSWETRLKKCDSIAAFRLDVECEPQIIEKINRALPTVTEPPRSWLSPRYWMERIISFPALGYKDLLNISLNGNPVYTGAIDDNLKGQEIITRWLNGNKLVIYNNDAFHWDKTQATNWYGQFIKCQIPTYPFRFVFEVRSGRPINPKAPVREGFIEDKAFESFRAELENIIFEELCSLETNWATPENIKALYKINPERANRECPYITAAPMLPYEPGANEERESEKGADEVFLKENAPLLIQHQVRAIGRGSCYYGVCSFVEEIAISIAAPYELTCNSAKPVKYLVWKPGKPVPNREDLSWFRARGEFCLSDEEPKPDIHWHPTEAQWYPVNRDVFAFNEADNWDIETVDWTIGCEDPVRAIKSLGYAGFNPYNDERDTDDLLMSYEESLESLIFRLSPPPPIDAISADVRREILAHIAKRLARPESTQSIVNVVVTLSDDNPQSMVITGKRLLTVDGKKEPFHLVARVYE